MMKFAILFALVAAAAAETVPQFSPLNPVGRIIGGKDVSIYDVPYQVSIQLFGSHFCGGSIISDQWILSAAHCMIYPNDWFTIRSGSTVSNSGGTVSTVASFINHPEYGRNSFGVTINDIALIRLNSPLTLGSGQAVIPLYSTGQEAVAGAPSIITGWGLLSEGGSGSITLQTITLPIISKAACSDIYSSFGGLPDGQICAGLLEGGIDSCTGDSGGPLAIDGALAGIVSWGRGCARPESPGAYSEVAYHRQWITENSGI